MSQLTIKTNNVPRFTIDAWELTEKERQEFDYLDWEAIDKGKDGGYFFRYNGQLHELGEFILPSQYDDKEQSPFKGWDGIQPDSYFIGLLIKVLDGFESVIVGRYYS